MQLDAVSGSTGYVELKVSNTQNGTYSSLNPQVTYPLSRIWEDAQSKVKLVSFNENAVSDIIQMTNSSEANDIGRLHLTFSTTNENSYDETSNIILTSNLNDDIHTVEEDDKLYASINLGQYWQIAYNAGINSVTHNPRVSASINTNVGLHMIGSITATCNTSNSKTFWVYKASETGTGYTDNSHNRTDTVVFEVNDGTIARFSLTPYWDAAYNAGVASSSTHNMSISLSKDSGGGSNSKYVRFAIDGSCNGSSAEPKYLFANIAESSSSNVTTSTYSKDNVVQFSTSNSSSGAGSIISSSYIPLSNYWTTALTAGENSVKVSSFSISTKTTHKQYTVTASLSNGTSSKFSIYHENERYNTATYYNEKNVISGYINNTENIIFDFATMWRVYDSVFTAYRTTSSTLRTRLQYTSTAKDQLLIKYSEECGILIAVDNTTHKLNVAIVGHSGTDLTNMTLVNDKIYTVQSTSATPTWVWGSDENALRI